MGKKNLEEKYCKKCKEKIGFCKHTIEEEFKEQFPDDCFDAPHLRRFVAIAETGKENMFQKKDKEISRLESELRKLDYLKQIMEEIVIKRLKEVKPNAK